MNQLLDGPNGIPIYYLGAKPEAGPKAAFFHFALSGAESLELHPYNKPAELVADPNIRVFSFTIPGHGDDLNKFDAMNFWAEAMAKGEYILEDFFDQVTKAIEWLIAKKIVDPEKIATGGISRGGFIATHVAARLKSVRTVLGFAPLTELMQLKEFSGNPELKKHADELSLVNIVDQLTHVLNFRFYIGNLDIRVNTDSCYHFIRKLAQKGHEIRARQQRVELTITQSIGHKGHGTAPHIFEEGAAWVKNILLGS